MKVLMICDDQKFFEEFIENLDTKDKQMLVASNGSDGFNIFSHESKDIRIIIIDEDIPDITISHLVRLMYHTDFKVLNKAKIFIIGREQYRDDLSAWITEELCYKNKPDAAKNLAEMVKKLHRG